MTTTIDLLKRAQECVPRQSLDGLAKAIGADRSNIRRYMKGKGFPNALHAVEIARILKMDVQEVIGIIMADKARSPEAAERARLKIPRVSSAATIAFALLAGVTGMANDARAWTAETVDPAIHYAN